MNLSDMHPDMMSETGDYERPRTTAMGLLTDAKEMLTAAKILHESGVWQVLRPTYYVLGHAMDEPRRI